MNDRRSLPEYATRLAHTHGGILANLARRSAAAPVTISEFVTLVLSGNLPADRIARRHAFKLTRLARALRTSVQELLQGARVADELDAERMTTGGSRRTMKAAAAPPRRTGHPQSYVAARGDLTLNLPDHLARRVQTAAQMLLELATDVRDAPKTVYGLVVSITSGAPEAEYPEDDVVLIASAAGELAGIAAALDVPLPLLLVAAGVAEATTPDSDTGAPMLPVEAGNHKP